MDNLSRSFYEVSFERDFLKRKKDAFQDLFSEIMEKCYPGDFQRVRPWGNIGDMKNDGYLKSKQTLFQVYAPNELTATKAISKIDEDFKGALFHWGEHLNCWVFVHNSRSGLGPEITKKLLELEKSNSPIKIKQWGFEELRQKVFSLNHSDISSLLGSSPSNNDMRKIGFEDLVVVLETIAGQQPPKNINLRPVSREKLWANALSDHVEMMLKAGMRKVSQVERFFAQYHNPVFGDEIAAAFQNQYQELKDANNSPDIIFVKLQEFAGGVQRGSPQHEAAVLAVMAYLFERCDIFENKYIGESS